MTTNGTSDGFETYYIIDDCYVGYSAEPNAIVQPITTPVNFKELHWDPDLQSWLTPWETLLRLDGYTKLHIDIRGLDGRLNLCVQHDEDNTGSVSDQSESISARDDGLYEIQNIPVRDGQYRLVLQPENDLPREIQYGPTRP